MLRKRIISGLSVLFLLAACAAPGRKAGRKVSSNVLFDMSQTENWGFYTDNTCEVSVQPVSGKKGDALEMIYKMNDGGWIGMWRAADRDLSDARGIAFMYRGEGSSNSLEFKLEDGDGSNFGAMVEGKSNAGSWTIVEMPFSNLKYWWGGDEDLDTSSIKVHFAVSKKDGDEGGEGKIIIDRVELLK